MRALKKEITILIEKLSALQPGPGSTEARVLEILRTICADAQGVSDPRRLATHFAELNHFWANAVAWCSELSRDLEKLIIMHAELLEENGGS